MNLAQIPVILAAALTTHAAINLTAPAPDAPLSASANGASYISALSADGSRAVFVSDADNLVAAQSSRRFMNIFLLERATGAITAITSNTDGNSLNPSISADGRWIIFESEASNLVANDTNDSADIFAYDTQTQTTRNLSAAGNSDSRRPIITPDARKILFESDATNLATVTDANNSSDVFLADLETGAISLVSMNSARNGTASGESRVAALSDDGDRVLFYSRATNLRAATVSSQAQQIWLRTISANSNLLVSDGAGTDGAAEARNATLSADGTTAAFIGHQGLVSGSAIGVNSNLFVRTLPGGALRPAFASGRTIRATATAMNRLGQAVAFIEDGILNMVFTENLTVQTLDLKSSLLSYTPPLRFSTDSSKLLIGHATAAAPATVEAPWASPIVTLLPSQASFAANATASAVLFDTDAPLHAEDHNRASDIYEATDAAPQLRSTALPTARKPAPVMSVHHIPARSLDGPAPSALVFNSYSDDIAPGDNNGFSDVFIYRQGDARPQLVSIAEAAANGHSFSPAVSDNGRYVAFASFASNLVTGDANKSEDVFLKDTQTGAIELITVPVRALAQGYTINTKNIFITDDARYVIYTANRNDVIATGTPGALGAVFIRDRQSGTTTWAHASLPFSSGYTTTITTDGRLGLVVMPNATTRDFYTYTLATGELRRIGPVVSDPGYDYVENRFVAQRTENGRTYLYQLDSRGNVTDIADYPGNVGVSHWRATVQAGYLRQWFLSDAQLSAADQDQQPDIYNAAGPTLISMFAPPDPADTFLPLAPLNGFAPVYHGTWTRAADWIRRSDLYVHHFSPGRDHALTAQYPGPQMLSLPTQLGTGVAFISDSFGTEGPMSYRSELTYLPALLANVGTRLRISREDDVYIIAFEQYGDVRLQYRDSLDEPWRDFENVVVSGLNAYARDPIGQTQRYYRTIFQP